MIRPMTTLQIPLLLTWGHRMVLTVPQADTGLPVQLHTDQHHGGNSAALVLLQYIAGSTTGQYA